MITLTEDTSVASCTGFLVAPDVLATNSHCIPKDLKASGSSCANRIWAVFPALDGFGKQRVECSSIIRASELEMDGRDHAAADRDYAFIRLKSPVARPVIAVSAEGLADQQDFYVHKVDPVKAVRADIIRGKLVADHCKAVQRTILLPEFDHATYKNMTFSDCTVMHGNSGSPMINARGEAIGIVQGMFDSPAAQLSKRLEARNVLLGAHYPTTLTMTKPIYLGTNLGCVPVLGANAISESTERSCPPMSGQMSPRES